MVQLKLKEWNDQTTDIPTHVTLTETLPYCIPNMFWNLSHDKRCITLDNSSLISPIEWLEQCALLNLIKKWLHPVLPSP